MGDFSSYYLYRKYEVFSDEIVPLDVYSIDADGTMDPVVKNECEVSCGCPQAVYRWVRTDDVICVEVYTQTISGDPYCVGYDQYKDVYDQISYDSGVTWETTASTSVLIETDCASCGYVPPAPSTQYRWVDSGTTCVGADKYNQKIKQVSYDSGVTWRNVSPTTYSATTLIETNSEDCGYSARTTSGSAYCTGVNKYVDVYSQITTDYGQTWTTTATTTTLIETNSADCGYRTRTISGDPYCDGADLVVVTSAQTSTDSGTTWTTTSTAVTTVEVGSAQCHQTVNVTGVTLSENSMSLNSSISSGNLTATVLPDDADDKSVTWSSSDSSVATVTPYVGLEGSAQVSGISNGNATITVTTNDGGYTAQCSVSVSSSTHDYSQDYFMIAIPMGGNLKFTKRISAATDTLFYSTDSGSTWSEFPNDEYVNFGSQSYVWFKGELTPNGSSGLDTVGIGTFSTSGSSTYITPMGNVMSLLYGDNFIGQTSLSNKGDAFANLFKDCDMMVRADNLILPSTTLGSGCYYQMFSGCSGLTTTPMLPATTLINACYYGMFRNCTSLTTAPTLSATTLASECYRNMFDGCTSLVAAPQLPATTLQQHCYNDMFKGCTSLTTAPSLPAATLQQYCYYGMFSGCTSLTTAPILSSTTLADACYKYMFYGCTSLTTAPTLPATTLVDSCYDTMFRNCTNLNSITCLATDISARYCTWKWVDGVAASGTFIKAASMTDWAYGVASIPYNWTVQDYTS